MASIDDEAEADFAEQDPKWTAPKFFGLGAITLAIALTIIVFMASRTGCTVAIVP